MAEFVEGHKPQPTVVFGKHKRSASLRERIAVTLFDGPAGLLSGDRKVLFFDGQIATGNQANQVYCVGRRPGLVEIIDSPDEAGFKGAERSGRRGGNPHT